MKKNKARYEDLPYHLTPQEIKALREDLKRSHAEAKRLFAEEAKREASRAKPTTRKRGK